LFAGCIENVAHAVSLAHVQAQKPNMHYIALRQQMCLVGWHKIGC
jgi:hypothetical protein